jgi:hypothetical protein
LRYGKEKKEKKEESYLPGRKPCHRGALARASPTWQEVQMLVQMGNFHTFRSGHDIPQGPS